MKSIQRNTLMLALAATLVMPATLMAANATKDEHSGHHPVAPSASAPAQANPAATQGVATKDPMQAMQARMMEIHTSKDPEKRRQLMEIQMKEMEAKMQDGSCPMMSDDKMGGQGGKCMTGDHGSKCMTGQSK